MERTIRVLTWKRCIGEPCLIRFQLSSELAHRLIRCSSDRLLVRSRQPSDRTPHSFPVGRIGFQNRAAWP